MKCATGVVHIWEDKNESETMTFSKIEIEPLMRHGKCQIGNKCWQIDKQIDGEEHGKSEHISGDSVEKCMK